MPATMSSISTVSPAAERVQEEAALWFARLRGDEVADAERAAFAAWLDADARHRREYNLLEQLWDASSQLRPPAAAKPKHRQALRAGASLTAIALVCGWLGWAWLDGHIATDPGELRHMKLADGSELAVAPNTRLRVKFSSDRRRIELDEGRIAVSVATDRQRPFEVAAGGGVVRDIGTRFEVDAGRDRTRVTVAEGMVEIDLPASDAAPQKVGAGETVDFASQDVSPVRPADAAALAWTKGRLAFDAAPLTEVVAALNRYRRTPIELADPSLGNIRISGVFMIDDERMALRALEQVAQIEFIPKAGKMEARPGGQLR